MKHSFLPFLLSLILYSNIYPNIIITGRVFDSLTDEPVAFCNVFLQSNQNLGTATNESGSFILSLPDYIQTTDSIVFSSLGYHLHAVDIQSLVGRISNKEFYLNPKHYELPHVEVFAPSEKARMIVATAIDNLSKNLNRKRHVLSAFYREYSINDSVYGSLIEADAHILDHGVSKRMERIRVSIHHIRRSDDIRHPIARNFFFRQTSKLLGKANGIYNAYETHPLKQGEVGSGWLNKRFLDNHNFFLIKQIVELDDTINVIRFSRIGNYQGEMANTIGIIHINHTDFGILQIEHTTTFMDYSDSQPFSMYSFFSFDKLEDGFYYPRVFKYESTIQSQLLFIYSVSEERADFTKVRRYKSIRRTDNLFDLNYIYDESFWDTFNIIQLAPPPERLMRDIERIRIIDEQFRTPI